jgi:hypothetical protein
MEMDIDALLPLRSAGDVRCLLKERHGGVAGGWCCASVVLVQQPCEFNLERALTTEHTSSQQQSPACPCSGGRMIIIETFRGASPRTRPATSVAVISIDTS